jgi:AAA+ ATPase superfamily predicted ATPase
MATYSFPNHDEFLDREAELTRLQRWWDDEQDRFPLVLYGRRRTGKTWLLREFAHGKDADIFVCDNRAEGDQLTYFAGALESSLGFRPELRDVRSFYNLLFRQQGPGRRLVVIDEFPLLLDVSRSADSSLAAAIEDREGDSNMKLVLCGSQIATMETLMAERAPLHGRGTPLLLAPMTFKDARRFLTGLRPEDVFTRYSIAGGMPLYLRRIGRKGSLRTVLCEDVFSPLAPFFDEAREVLSMELTSTATHFSLLAALAGSPSLGWEELIQRSSVDEKTASRYLRILEHLHIVEAANPVFAPRNARRRRYRVADAFIRFWFRFVFPHQADLTAGLRPEDHYNRNVAPFLSDHSAATFEDICRAWVRDRYRETTDTVGSWWGMSRHDLRKAGTRSTEEIDVVGGRGSTVTVVGECRWQNQPIGRKLLTDILEYKLPALGQTRVDTSSTRIVLFSKSGFRQGLKDEAFRRGDVELVDLEALLDEK